MPTLLFQIKASLLEMLGSGIKALPGLLVAAALLLITRNLSSVVRTIVSRALERVVRGTSLRLMLAQVVAAGVWVIGAMAAAVIAFPSLRLGDIVALVGLSSVAVGLVFQDLCRDLLAGLVLLLQEPINVNDEVRIDAFEGKIEEIGFRTTRVLGARGEVVLLPNAMLLTKPMRLLTAKPFLRTEITVEIAPSAPVDVAARALADAVRVVAEVETSPAPRVDVVAFHARATELVVKYWTRSEPSHVIAVKTTVMIELRRACTAAGIVLAEPAPTAVVEKGAERSA